MGNFASNLDISTIFKQIKSELNDENRTITDMMDRYFVEYPNIGYNQDGQLANSICVVVIPGTKDIITMYPEVSQKMVTKKDIMKTLNRESAKVNSRVSKFNSKFANFTPPTKK